MAMTGAARAVAAILRPGRPLSDSGQGFEAVVDGVAITVRGEGPMARLTCRLRDELPDEAALRDLLARYLRHAGEGAERICIEPGGTLVLLVDLDVGEALEGEVARFCDAALHWRAAAAGLRAAAPARFNPAAAQIIYP